MDRVPVRSPVPQPICESLAAIPQHLQSTGVEVLFTNVELKHCCLREVTKSIPRDLEKAIKSTAFFEFCQFDVAEALQRMDDRLTQGDHEARATKS
jgi:hypothetical protein